MAGELNKFLCGSVKLNGRFDCAPSVYEIVRWVERIPMPIYQEHLNEAENKADLLNKAITRDKLWAYG